MKSVRHLRLQLVLDPQSSSNQSELVIIDAFLIAVLDVYYSKYACLRQVPKTDSRIREMSSSFWFLNEWLKEESISDVQVRRKI